jgi:hypothetical protein
MRILNISLVVYLAIMSVDLARSQVLPNDDEIRQLLADRIDVQQKSVGMVVGIITPHGRRLITYGRLNQTRDRSMETLSLKSARLLRSLRPCSLPIWCSMGKSGSMIR